MTVQRRQLPDTSWCITDMAVIEQAIDGVLAAQPYWRPSISRTEAGLWQVEFNADGPSRYVRAVTGDWLMIDFVGAMGDTPAGPQLQKLSADEAVTYYEVGV